MLSRHTFGSSADYDELAVIPAATVLVVIGEAAEGPTTAGSNGFANCLLDRRSSTGVRKTNCYWKNFINLGSSTSRLPPCTSAAASCSMEQLAR